MSDLIKIAEELNRLCSALRVAVQGYESAIRDAADKRTVYDVQWAKALLSQSDGTVKEKEAEATTICESFMREARIAEAQRDAFKERLRAIQSVISVQQSLLRHLEETSPSGF